MKLVIERAALLATLGHVQNVVERKSTIPILQNVRLEATKGRLSLRATDMDMEIAEDTVAAVGQPGATTAPAHILHDIARKLPDGSQVEIAMADGTLTVAAGRSRFKLACLPVEDYPAFAGGEYSHSFVIQCADLATLIDRTRFAISTEETRYYLNGIYLHTAKSEGVTVLRAVATDGHRLARAELPLPAGAGGMPGVIVPRKAVAEIRKLVDDAAGVAEVSLSDAKIRLKVAEVEMCSKLIDGTFPDYERVIPQGNDKDLEVECQPLADAVDRVASIATERTRAIKVNLENGLITLTAAESANGTATEEVEGQYNATPIEIGFNHRYLIEVLGQVDGDKARISFADAGSPALIRDIADPSALYVLMPMRV